MPEETVVQVLYSSIMFIVCVYYDTVLSVSILFIMGF